MAGVFLGLDLGGTKILALVADGRGRVVGRARRSTPAGGDAIVRALGAAAEEAMAAAGVGRRDLAGVGVGAPGPLDPEAGVLLEAPNLQGANGLRLGDLLTRALGAPVRLENDANAAALAEHRYGAGRGSAAMVYVTLSTGIGGGVVADGRLLRGSRGLAGEVGHMILQAGGPPCAKGHRGCWEALASGAALARSGRTAADLAAAAREGDPEAQDLVARAARYNGVGLFNVVMAFDPDTVVVGGGLSRSWELFVAPAVDWVRAHAFEASSCCRFVPAALGDDAVAVGALALAREAAGA